MSRFDFWVLCAGSGIGWCAVGLSACLKPQAANGGNADVELAPDPKAGLPYTYEVPAAVKRATTLLEAEDGSTTGKVNAFGTKLHTPAAEASGRRFVWLAPEQSVSWRTRVAADGLVVRFSFPDSADGKGAEGELEVNVDGRAVSTLKVTSRFSWDYGKPNWDSTDVWSSEPRRVLPRHFWDEASVRLPSAIPVGATLALVNHGSAPQQVAIDFVELETVTPRTTRPHITIPIRIASHSIASSLHRTALLATYGGAATDSV